MALSAGTQLGHFKIVGHLGAGGMGEVYRARDTKLGREVAIKVLREDFAQNAERLIRFEREAKILASLNHNCIGALYDFQTATLEENIPRPSGPPPSKGDFGESATGSSPPLKGDLGGCTEVRFLVLELVEGETLADRIDRGPLSVKETLPLVIQIAEGLEAAHENGIIHRDLKPANIKITPEGKIKVLDFGMAKPIETIQSSSPTAATKVSGTDPTKVTTDGTILGTPAYMSPEQARGQEVDKRTDIWAFGCCLYETLTGRAPFGGKTVSDLMVAILDREPDWEKLPASVPESVTNLVRHCLEKGTRRRLRDAGDIAITLEDAAEALSPRARAPHDDRESGPPGNGSETAIDKIAVLPFTNISGKSDQEWFADGMTEQIIMELAKVKALTVISRTSAMQYKGVVRSIPVIARELNVHAVVEGSVLRVGDEVRITAQLIHGATDEHLWAENYTGTMENVLRLQSEVALSIAREIGASVTPDERSRMSAHPVVDPEAYTLYVQGRHFLYQRTAEGFESARSLFERALDIDPGFALAHVNLGDSFGMQADYGFLDAKTGFTRCEREARLTLVLAPALGEAHATLGFVNAYYHWNWREAERHFLKAIDLSPSYASAHHWYGHYLLSMSRFNEGVHAFEKAFRLDPLSPIISALYGVAMTFAEMHHEALAHMAEAERLHSEAPIFQRWYGLVRSLAGDHRQALLHFEKAVKLTKNEDMGMNAFLIRGYAGVGDIERARKLQTRQEELYTAQKLVPFWIAYGYVFLEETETAFEWLEKAFNERDPNLALHVRDFPSEFRRDPRYQDLLKKMNFPEN